MSPVILQDRFSYDSSEKFRSGGWSKVFKGYDLKEQREVAIKILEGQASGDDLLDVFPID